LYPRRGYSLLLSISDPQPQMSVRKSFTINSPDILELTVLTVRLKS